MYLLPLIKILFQHFKIIRIVKKCCKEEKLLDTLSRLIGSEFRIDWIGRIYSVINPVIKDGKFDAGQALEYTDTGLSNEEYIKHWFFDRLGVIENFIKVNNLFDLLTFRIESLDNMGNHLVILYPITSDQIRKKWIGAGIELIVIILLVIKIVTWF